MGSNNTSLNFWCIFGLRCSLNMTWRCLCVGSNHALSLVSDIVVNRVGCCLGGLTEGAPHINGEWWKFFAAIIINCAKLWVRTPTVRIGAPLCNQIIISKTDTGNPSVCPSHAGIVSKRQKISSNFLHLLVAPSS